MKSLQLQAFLTEMYLCKQNDLGKKYDVGFDESKDYICFVYLRRYLKKL